MIVKLLNILEPEISHKIVLSFINYLPKRNVNYSGKEIKIFEKNLKHPVGIAAGFDKNCKMIHGLRKLGFSHCEIGTITPFPRKGNKGKRIVKLKDEQIIFNNMGLPNDGFEVVKRRLKKFYYEDFCIGVNIGLSGDEPPEDREKLLIYMIEELNNLKSCSYITLNVSCPNVKKVVDLETLISILNKIKSEKPILVKFSCDEDASDLVEKCQILLEKGVSGFVIGNTIKNIPDDLIEKNTINGAMSGKRLRIKSDALISSVREKLGNNFIIIGCGGIVTPLDAFYRINSGANLIQLYTGFVYNGPKILDDILKFTQ